MDNTSGYTSSSLSEKERREMIEELRKKIEAEEEEIGPEEVIKLARLLEIVNKERDEAKERLRTVQHLQQYHPIIFAKLQMKYLQQLRQSSSDEIEDDDSAPKL